MSNDTLPSEVPVDPTAALEVPEDTPSATPVGSMDSTDVIPKERFNGLMTKYHTDKSAWETEKSILLSELDSYKATPIESNEEIEVTDDRVLTELQELRSELAAQKLETARAESIARHPAASPLADLIVGNTPKEIEAMTAEIAARLQGLTAVDATDTPPTSDGDSTFVAENTTPVDVPTIGGAASFQGDVAIDEAIGDALAKKDFSAFIAAAARRAELNYGADI